MAPPALERHDIGLVVIDPVADILDAVLGQEIERVPCLLQARAQPSAGRVPVARAISASASRMMRGSSSGGTSLRRRVLVSLWPIHSQRRFCPSVDDLGMARADMAVERDGAADAIALEHLHQPEHADAVAIVARRPGRHIRHLAAGAAGARRHLVVEREELDVGNDPERQSRAIGPCEARAADDRRIGKGTVGAGLHGRGLAGDGRQLSRAAPAMARRWGEGLPLVVSN